VSGSLRTLRDAGDIAAAAAETCSKAELNRIVPAEQYNRDGGVAAFAANPDIPPPVVTITSTGCRTSSAAKVGRRR
jgi:hypothetical protein